MRPGAWNDGRSKPRDPWSDGNDTTATSSVHCKYSVEGSMEYCEQSFSQGGLFDKMDGPTHLEFITVPFSDIFLPTFTKPLS